MEADLRGPRRAPECGRGLIERHVADVVQEHDAARVERQSTHRVQ